MTNESSDRRFRERVKGGGTMNKAMPELRAEGFSIPWPAPHFFGRKKFRCEKNKPILSPCVISPRTLSPLVERFHLSRSRAEEHALQARRAEERLGRILFFSSCFVANLASFVLSSSSSKVPPIAVGHRT